MSTKCQPIVNVYTFFIAETQEEQVCSHFLHRRNLGRTNLFTLSTCQKPRKNNLFILSTCQKPRKNQFKRFVKYANQIKFLISQNNYNEYQVSTTCGYVHFLHRQNLGGTTLSTLFPPEKSGNYKFVHTFSTTKSQEEQICLDFLHCRNLGRTNSPIYNNNNPIKSTLLSAFFSFI